MIGIGWTEMLVIGVVALIFIGPKELPGLMSRVGKAVGAIRRMGADFQREINRSTGLDQVTDLRRTITEPLKKTGAEIAKEFNAIGKMGAVQPSGVIKPADPKAESVVSEIRAAAGLEAPAGPIKSAPVKAAIKAKPAPTAPVMTADLPPVKEANAARRRLAKPVESPAPIEALAPAVEAKPKAVRKRKPAADKS